MTSTFRVEDYTEEECNMEEGGKRSLSKDCTVFMPQKKVT
jgi:hypothetical protein